MSAYLPRHGYPVIFVERQVLLRKLYENMRQKDKVLLQKRFTRLEQAENGVRVITQDGCSYAGDIVIGADGMHSPVRKQMHCLANILSPGYFDMDEYSSEWPVVLCSKRRIALN
jgi:2-polyprenyl-6-methoxyphenol hydroxylase-like FAD-dependent oxidoreductase